MSGDIKSEDLGKMDIGKLLLKQAIPAAMGFLVMSIYMIVDTIFVGHYVNFLGIGAISVVMPIVFFISAVGMSIGVGGGSIISRMLGEAKVERAKQTFGNIVGITISLALILVCTGYYFMEPVLKAFGAQGQILPVAEAYFGILLLGIPFLAWAMMSNNVIRSEGKAKKAMLIMLIPALSNIFLDWVFIALMDWGIEGAAWATTISYGFSALYAIYFFVFGETELVLKSKHFIIDWAILHETISIGGITFIRQASISLLVIVLNNTLFKFGGEEGVALYGIVNRVAMFAFFPIIGIMQGFMPIAGFNYGAKEHKRVLEVIFMALKYVFGIGVVVLLLVLATAPQIAKIFTTNQTLIENSPFALTMVFLVTPFIGIQMVSAAYFQAIGKVVPALLLTLSKQGFFLIPLVYFLPISMGLDGVWYAFPIADIAASILTVIYLIREIKMLQALSIAE